MDRIRSSRGLWRIAALWICALGMILACATAGSGAEPLGARYNTNGSAITFRVYSSRATRIEVWVYAQPQGQTEKARYALAPDNASHVWSKTVNTSELQASGITGTVFYGYRAWGPNWAYKEDWTPGSSAGFVADVDGAGNRFNPNKLLLDPYAREVSHDYRTPAQRDSAIYLSGLRRTTDTGRQAPKGAVLKDDLSDFGTKPKRAFKEDIIYEVHLRGLTKLDPSIPAELRGTYAGAGRKAVDLKALGVTAVEFLPVFEFQNDTNGLNPSSAEGDNYWGYDPDGLFAPDRRYAADKGWGGPTREFKGMVKAFHDQGLKVYLDVVYNHTGEGDVDKDTGQTGRIQSWRGLDNPTYYELRDDNAPYEPDGRPTQWRDSAFYSNNNGVGPNLNVANRVVRDLVLDSMKYWSNEMGVDGFRCDLAAVLGNTQERGGFFFDKLPGDNILNRAAKELPARQEDGSGVELIAEPYGAKGNGTFQLGNFPTGWAEWNDRFRYPFRRSQNKLGIGGQEVSPAELIRHFAGSSDLFQPNGRKPYHGINYIVAHDGFTLRDLYSYNAKRNDQLFPFGPSPGGSDNNISWDQNGAPAMQRQAARNGLALNLMSAGVPMIVGGDEMYRTQYGNNNPFNLDNDRFYLDYSNIQTFSPFHAYTKGMLAFRRAHPVLHRSEFYDGRDHNHNGLKNVTWLRDNGQEADAGYLDNVDNHFIAFRLDATEAQNPILSLYIAYNGWKDDIQATLPDNLPQGHWYVVVDTSSRWEDQNNFFTPPRQLDRWQYKVAARSVVILIEQP